MTKKHVIKFTESGFKELQLEYKTLLDKRPEFVKELTIARDMGDRSENAAYKGARRKLSSTDSRLRFLKKLIENATIIKPTNLEYVDIGTRVTINNGLQDITFFVVGEHEANPTEKKLSHKSPVGHALLGKKVGDTVTINIPSGTIVYTIRSIS